MKHTVVWDRRLTPVEDSDEVCHPWRHELCDGLVKFILTYWSAQGQKRTPAMSRRPLCVKHAEEYRQKFMDVAA